MIERSGDIKILYRKFTRSIERWCSSLPPLGVIRLESSHTLVFTIFLHGLNISRDYRNFHSPWSMVFRYERLTSVIFSDGLFLQETPLFSVPINYVISSYTLRFYPNYLAKVSLSQDREIKPTKSEMENQESRILKFLSPLFPRSSKLTAEYDSNSFPARNAIYHAR